MPVPAFSFDFETDRDYDALRAFLESTPYTTERVCERMEIPTIYNFKSIVEGRTERVAVTDTLDALIRLFMDAEPVAEVDLTATLPDGGAALLSRLGLLAPYDDTRVRATALLYPTRGLWIASDLDHHPLEEQRAGDMPEDVVYPAITRNTQHFMSSLPQLPCERFLELCSGTGIAALAAAEYAGHTWAVDITERSTRCARFNARLNRIENLTALEGDLYEPVQDLRFDRIVAHPPYIPAEKLEYIYRDGGQDGEQITRRIVEGLPDLLEPGGRFHATCMVTDRDQQPFERRVRDWLGSRENEFDVLIVEMGTMHPTEHYTREAMRGRMSFDVVARRHQLFTEMKIVELLYCSFVLQRRARERSVFTARTQRGPRTTGKDFDWLLRWETAQAEGGVDWLPRAKLRSSPRVRLRVVHEMRDREWMPAEYRVGAESPFISTADCPAWGAALIARCTGDLTVEQHFAALKEAGALPEDAPLGEFLDLVRSLITAGFVEAEEFPLPFQSGNGRKMTSHELFREDRPGELY